MDEKVMAVPGSTSSNVADVWGQGIRSAGI